MEKKPFIFSAKFILISAFLTAGIFAACFYGLQSKITMNYDASIVASPSIMLFSPARVGEVKNMMLKYGPIAGIAFGLVFLIISYLFYAIAAIVRLGKKKFTAPFVQFITSLLIFIFAYNLAFDSEHGTAISSGIVYYLGFPLYYVFMIMTILLLILLIVSFVPRKNIAATAELAVGLFALTAILSGCNVLAGTTSLACAYLPDSPHCYQEAAVASNDPVKCEKVGKKEELKDLDSNPPKDKCYYMVAENTKDPRICNNIKGGTMSYTVNECAESVVSKTEKNIKDTFDSGKKLTDEDIAKIQLQMKNNQDVLNMTSEMTRNMHDMNQAAVRNLR